MFISYGAIFFGTGGSGASVTAFTMQGWHPSEIPAHHPLIP